jgi:hypothetical protein
MADTRVQVEVEDWIRENWMRERFGQEFYRNRIKLSSGGVFDFDAVSIDKSIAASISTSSAKTSGGKHAVGKLMKLRSDMLFLLMAEGPSKRYIVLTEESMHATCLKEKVGGRIPHGIEFLLAAIPQELEERLVRARAVASREVSPTALTEVLPDELLLQKSEDSAEK